MDLTLQLLLDHGTARLAEAGISEAVLDSKYLLFEAFQTDMTHFLMDRYRRLTDEDSVKRAIAEYQRMIELRAKRIPLQQITGSREFMGLEFKINEHVLIPRQDTETLVELVLKEQKGRELSVLDVCTGSGCIGVSLMALGGYSQVTALDISQEALLVAAFNGKMHLSGRTLLDYTMSASAEARPVSEKLTEIPWKLELQAETDFGSQSMVFLKSDLFSALTEDQQFDVIVSNPPYIPSDVIEGLEPEVKDYEPRLALDGMEDGLYFYRKIAAECSRHLKPGGAVYFEIGYNQGEAVSELLKQAGFHDIRVIKDAPGLDRVVYGGF